MSVRHRLCWLLVAGLAVSILTLLPNLAWAVTVTLMEARNPVRTVGVGVPNEERIRQNSAIFHYTGGVATVSFCPNGACAIAFDDEIRLTVTHPDGSTAFRKLTSRTLDLPAATVTDLFEVGINTILVELYDLMGPEAGLANDLYLLETSGPPGPGQLPTKRILLNDTVNKNKTSGQSNDPVNTFSGDFIYQRNDVAIPGRGPTPTFTRTYMSSGFLEGSLGPGWAHNYAVQLVTPEGSPDDIAVIGPEGRADVFTASGGGFDPPDGIYTELTRDGSTYRLTDKDQTTWNFGSTGRLSRITDRHGAQSRITYTSDDRLASVSDPAGRGVMTFTYNEASLLSEVADWSGRKVTYGYDDRGRLISVRDREGHTAAYSYDGEGSRLTSITDARDHVAVTNTYDAVGRVTTQKDARGIATGQQTDFAYSIHDDGSRTTIVTYPPTSFEPGWRFVVEDTHDSKGRLVKRISKPTSSKNEWITEARTYDAVGNLASVKDGRGNTTTYCYDVDYSGATVSGSRGNRTRVIQPAPQDGAKPLVMLLKYDDKDNAIQTIKPRGVPSRVAVDCTTDLTAGLDLKHATDMTYDSNRVQLLATTIRFTDPELGPQTAVTKYLYEDPDNPGQVTKEISPRGNTGPTPDLTFATSFSRQPDGPQAGMLASVTTPSGSRTTYQYDAVGRMLRMTDPRGNEPGANPAHFTWEYVWDKEDRQRFVKAPPPAPGQDPLVTEFRYDFAGNRTSSIDPNRQVTRYTYDDRDSLKQVQQSSQQWTDPAENPTGLIVAEYEYDHLGNMTRATRAQGDSANERVVDYTFDGLNRVRSEAQYPNWPSPSAALVSEFAYDRTGNRTTLKDPLGKVTRFGYDAVNQLISTVYNSPTTPDVNFTFDANGNRTNMIDGTGTTIYVYDEMDRLISVRSPKERIVAYRYDLNSNQRKLIYPDSTAVTYRFDRADRMSGLTDWADRETSYHYLANGKVSEVENFNGTNGKYAFDNAGRLTDVWSVYGSETINRYTYGVDAAGNRTGYDEVTNGAADHPTPIEPKRLANVRYEYDKLYRLKKEARQFPMPEGDSVISYAYDPAGNRLGETTTAGQKQENRTFAYDRADRIQSSGGSSPEQYTVDSNGNLILRGKPKQEVPLSYDQANRMVSAKPTGSTFAYRYDGDGKRVSVTKNGRNQLNDYVYDTNRQLPVLLQDLVEGQKFVWGLGLLYAVDRTGAPFVYHVDGQGSVTALTSETKGVRPRIVDFESYKAFGTQGHSNRNFKQPFRYTGEQLDDHIQSEYVYLRARYYDPAIGRFTSRDPAAGNRMNPQSLNRYSYVENNPANYTDPSGNQLIGHIDLERGTEGYGFQVTPTILGRTFGLLPPTDPFTLLQIREVAWNEFVSKVDKNEEKSRVLRAAYSSFRDQFLCHWDFARLVDPSKSTWNLELHRAYIGGYFGVVAHSCNQPFERGTPSNVA